MKYQTSVEYENMQVVKIIKPLSMLSGFERVFETVFLAQFEIVGFHNKVSVKRRMASAAIQTFWSTILLHVIGTILIQLNTISDKGSATSMVALVAGIFGATFYREFMDVRGKWLYLANLFNEVVKQSLPTDALNSYNRRVHLSAFLSHDILIMGMWSHASFKEFFKETLEKAVLYRCNGNVDVTHRELERIARDGIEIKEAKTIIGNYIDFLRPTEDKVGHIFRTIGNLNKVRQFRATDEKFRNLNEDDKHENSTGTE